MGRIRVIKNLPCNNDHIEIVVLLDHADGISVRVWSLKESLHTKSCMTCIDLQCFEREKKK